MKHRFFMQSVALVVLTGLLFTGMALPTVAASVSDRETLSNDFLPDDDFIKDDSLSVSDEILLSAEDPEISEKSMILKYVDAAQFDAARHTLRLTEAEELNTYVFANADGHRLSDA